MTDDIGARLDDALASRDVWRAMFSLVEDRPPGLADAIERRYPAASDDVRSRCTWLLGLLKEDGDPVLSRLVLDAVGESARDLLSTIVSRRIPVPADVLTRLRDELGDVREVVDAMGVSGDLSFGPRLADLLDDPTVGTAAALAIAGLGDRRHVDAIGAGLRGRDGTDLTARIVALGMLRDRTAVPHLLGLLESDPEPWFAQDVHRALTAITGRDPLVETLGAPAVAVAAAWRREPLDAPRVTVSTMDDRRADLAVDHGTGRVAVTDDPPSPGTYWPRWSRSLVVDGALVYRTSSICGTCESMMGLLGWPETHVAASVTDVRDATADVIRVDASLTDALSPLLAELTSGHYRLDLVDVEMERAVGERSWWHRRYSRREYDQDDVVPFDAAENAPLEHFQAVDAIDGDRPGYVVAMPTQDVSELDRAVVDAHRGAIERGRRPAAVLFGWVEDRDVEVSYPERFLVSVVLDGHHRLAAYGEAGVPARVVLITRTEDRIRWDGVVLPALDEMLAVIDKGRP